MKLDELCDDVLGTIVDWVYGDLRALVRLSAVNWRFRAFLHDTRWWKPYMRALGCLSRRERMFLRCGPEHSTFFCTISSKPTRTTLCARRERWCERVCARANVAQCKLFICTRLDTIRNILFEETPTNLAVLVELVDKVNVVKVFYWIVQRVNAAFLLSQVQHWFVREYFRDIIVDVCGDQDANERVWMKYFNRCYKQPQQSLDLIPMWTNVRFDNRLLSTHQKIECVSRRKLQLSDTSIFKEVTNLNEERVTMLENVLVERDFRRDFIYRNDYHYRNDPPIKYIRCRCRYLDKKR